MAVSLPYANASFSRSVNREHPGINFSSRIYSFDLLSESEDNYKITVQTKDLVLNNYVLIFIVKGRSVFCMVKNKRIGMIGFFGTLKKI
ncbi:hypothetical protein [Pedobacter sp. MC2016-14]|uniref:hypothetical protein n=1 Tax=Pedobacter sp. MC2016-14 TaxID=2897327 RepID=UPI00351D823E